MKKLTWLSDLQSFVGVFIGLIMLSIGSVMFLNSGAKLYILGYESDTYFSAEDQCTRSEIFPIFLEQDKTAPISPQKTQKKTPEEIEKCIEKTTQKEKTRYTRDKLDNMLDGAIMIIVGFPPWFFHRQRKEKKIKAS